MAQTTLTRLNARPAATFPGLSALLGWVDRALAVHRQRAALSTIDPRLLEDMGISAEGASRESDRPFWDLP